MTCCDQHFPRIYQFSRGENGLELFISSMASLWMQPDGARAAKCWIFCISRKLSRFVVKMEPLSQLCVINAGRNLCGKLMHAEECFLLWKAAANKIYAVTEPSSSAVKKKKQSNLAVFVPLVHYFHTAIKNKTSKNIKQKKLTRDLNMTPAWTWLVLWSNSPRWRFSFYSRDREYLVCEQLNHQYIFSKSFRDFFAFF